MYGNEARGGRGRHAVLQQDADAEPGETHIDIADAGNVKVGFAGSESSVSVQVEGDT